MKDQDKLVAVISPWEKINEVAKRNFRLESLPAEKKVMVWRDDLQTEEQLTEELRKIGITAVELRRRKPIDWKETD